MSVWFVIPSKRPLAEANVCFSAWMDMGYRVAVAREPEDGIPEGVKIIDVSTYQGWARSVNLLTSSIMALDLEAAWFVTGGDDYFPDPTKRADEIAAECAGHFMDIVHNSSLGIAPVGLLKRAPQFGVMQPTGDRWGQGRCTTCQGSGTIDEMLHCGAKLTCLDCRGTGVSAVIDRICGSPWMGREFCRRMYHGGGPLYNGYYHNFADEELQHVARKLGVLWQRRDLTQTHRHWAQKQTKSATHTGLAGDVRNMPEWARKINDPALSDWDQSKALFAKRKAAGFPGHEPLEV